MKKINKIFLISITFVFLTTAFNNCGSSFELQDNTMGSNSFASKEICESELRAHFQRTYHPFLIANCNTCHAGAQGSRDLNTAYAAFRARGEELIDFQATHAHGGNNLSSAQQIQINVFKPSWTSAQEDYKVCVTSSAGGGGVTGLQTLPKEIPNIMATADNGNWITVEWDLSKDVEGWAVGQVTATYKVEAKLNKVNGAIAGLLVRNPSLKINGGPNLLVSGLMIHLDGREQTAVTTYSSIYKVVGGTDFVKLLDASGSAYSAYPNFTSQSRLAFQFKELLETNLSSNGGAPPVVTPPIVVEIPDVVIPAGGVTFSQLTNSSSQYRVFNRSCTGCHNSGSGRLDLTNYEAASAAAAMITQRMNDAAAPMPPTGLLRQNDRDIVGSWVSAGTPR